MKPIQMLPLAAAALLLVAVAPAHALWRQMEVTRKYPVADDHAFTVTSKPDEGGRLKVEITVKPEGKKPLSPFSTGLLWLHDGQRLLGEVPVQETREKGALRYSFKIDPKLVESSRFELSESFAVPVSPKGSRFGFAVKDGYEQIMGGQIFTMKLAEFLTPGKAD